MSHVLVALWLLFLIPTSQPVKIDPFVGPKPIAVLIQSDTPKIAIYENGDVIFVKQVDGKFVEHIKRIEGEEFEKIKTRIAEIANLANLASYYDDTGGATDQQSTMFISEQANTKLVL